MAKRNQNAKQGYGLDVNEPQDAIHMGEGKRIRLEDVPLEDSTGDKQIGNRAYNDARYQLKGTVANNQATFLEGGFWVYTGTGLIFQTVKTVFLMPGFDTPFKVESTLINLADFPALDNGTLPQYVRPVWDTAGTVSPLFGTASADPGVPSVSDPLTQIAGDEFLLKAGATSVDPGDGEGQVQTKVIFAEGSVGEATWIHSGSGSTNFANTTSPINGTLDTNVSSVQNNSRQVGTMPENFNPQDFETISLDLKLKAVMLTGYNLAIQFWDAANTPVSSLVNLPIDKNSTAIQKVGLAITDFTFSAGLARKVVLQWRRGSGSVTYIGFNFDNFVLQGGLATPIVQGDVVLQGQVSGSGKTGTPINVTITEKAVSDQEAKTSPSGNEEAFYRDEDGSLKRIKISDIPHNLTKEKQGGLENEYFHLTEEQHGTLISITRTLDPDDDSPIQYQFPTPVKGSPATDPDEFVTLSQLPVVQQYGRLSGGVIQYSGSGLTYNFSRAILGINGEVKAESGQVTLDPADPTNPRFDGLGWEKVGEGIADRIKITGDPLPSPPFPQFDPETQVEGIFVNVPAAATTPVGVTTENVYLENTEWAVSFSGIGSGDPDSTANPKDGTKAIETSAQRTGFKIILDRGSVLDLNTFTEPTLGWDQALKSTLANNQNFDIIFLDGSGNAASNLLQVAINKATTAYQFIGINLDAFTFTTKLIRYIEIRYRQNGAGTFNGAFFDNIKIQGGVSQPPNTGGGGISDAPNSNPHYRKAGSWVAFTPLAHAPSDGNHYASKDGGWVAFTPFSGAYADLSGKPTLFSGAYADLSGKPTLFTVAGTPSEGQVVTSIAGVPTWATPSGGGGGISGLTTGKIPKATSSTTIADSLITDLGTGNGAIIFGANTGASVSNPLNVSFGGTFGTNTPGSAANLKWDMYNNGAGDRYGIGMSSALMEFRAGNAGQFAFYSNNGDNESLRIDSNGNMNLPDARTFFVKLLRNEAGTASQSITVQSSILVSPFSGLAQLDLGPSFGSGTVGDGSNTKLHIFKSGATTYGIGISSALMEFKVPTNAAMAFFTNGESLRILNTRDLQLANGVNLVVNTTTGTKIATATNQKLSFWNKTPIIQPTTGITGAALSGGGGTAITDTHTFGGYTLQQLAAILINTGLAA